MSVTVTTNNVTEINPYTAVCGGTVTGTSEGEYLPLVDLILISKFKLYNKSRQKITSNVKITNCIRPFQLFEDLKQADSNDYKRFILTGFVWKPISEVLEVELNEYDNITNVDLTDV